ncbi:triose-phosphate isomerase [Dictyobacter arantiisoli]|uniref:Triosephosphate isomerase n=1 Tax=Dictyobacter arantiisoli TaxID=2014874 RepID=A0A5A5T5R1_9CHLR|nr:triose-phosphate isomerase [Dictyobacter arantiisoli]GCF06687.1 triosephosphate isomerase [Dictyobacter arantiisoli]
MTIARTAIIAGNWKMNFGPKQAASFTSNILPTLGKITRANPHVLSIICPPAISLAAVHEVMEAMPAPHIELGAQNMYFEEKGAFTGEISPEMVKELCTTVILGHSERRGYFHENDELVNKKVLAALNHGLRPIICVGENLAQYESGKTHSFIETQIQHSLANLDATQAKQIVIAYEPIWAIGTGKAATAEGANQVIHFIRHTYTAMYGQTAADTIHILYGGSVTGANIADFIAYADIDGALIGGSSIKSDFAEILQKTANLYQS